MKLPLLTSLCNQAVSTYESTKDACHPKIEQIEQRVQGIVRNPKNASLVRTLVHNKRLSHSNGHYYVILA